MSPKICYPCLRTLKTHRPDKTHLENGPKIAKSEWVPGHSPFFRLSENPKNMILHAERSRSMTVTKWLTSFDFAQAEEYFNFSTILKGGLWGYSLFYSAKNLASC